MKQLTIALLIVMPAIALGQTRHRHAAQSLPLVSSLEALSVLGAENMEIQGKQDTSAKQERVISVVLPFDSEPKITKRKEPVYPEEALSQKLEGTVWLKVWVDSTGKASQQTVLKSTNELFNKAALDAVRQFEFAPALHGGKPVSIWVSLPIRFNLPEKLAEADSVRKWLESHPELAPKSYSDAERIVRRILGGERGPEVRASVDTEAVYVEGSQCLKLNDVLWGNRKSQLLSEGPKRVCIFVQGWRGEDRSSGTVLMQTQDENGENARVHTVMFLSGGGKNLIRLWHCSQ